VGSAIPDKETAVNNSNGGASRLMKKINFYFYLKFIN
jgi:hypothetical protein